MGMAAILVTTRTIWTNFHSPIPLRLHMKFGFDWPSGFWEEDVQSVWTTDNDDDGWTMELAIL